MKKILIVWIIVAVIMVSGLTFIGFKLTDKYKPYTKLESDLKESAESYVGMYTNLLSSNNIKITNQEMIDKKFSKELKTKNDKCDGYVVITKSMEMYDYKPYIKCKNYTTKGYSA
jgi:uncharacterized protein YxeA